MFKKSIPAFLVFFFCINCIQAQSVSTTEKFDAVTFPPAGWKLNPFQTGSQNAWTRVAAGNFPTCTPYLGAGMVRFNSRNAPLGTTQQLVSKAVNYLNRGTSAAQLSFWMYRDNISINYDSIEVWVNNTDSIDINATKMGVIARNRNYMKPDTQSSNGWYNYSFSVPLLYTNDSTTHFIFQGISDNAGGQGTGANMFIDEINYDEFPMPCTGVPNVGNIISNQTVICNGSGSTNLNFSNPILNAAGITYLWLQSSSYSGPYTTFGSNAPTANTGTITTKTFYKCYVTCAASASNYTTPIDSINVISAPSPTLSITPNPAAICSGSTNGIVLKVTGALTYVWSPSATLSSNTGDSVIATPLTNTQYIVIGTDSNGCKATANRNVTISNPPNGHIVSNPSDTVCSGNTVILNYQGGPQVGNTYLWSNNITTRRDTLLINATIKMFVEVTNAAGCKAKDSITITANPAQHSNFGFTQIGNTVSFVDSTLNATNWVWSFGDGNGSTVQNPVYTYSASGSYIVSLVVTGPCKTDTLTKTIQISTNSIQNSNQFDNVIVAPNPATDFVNISLNNNWIENISILNELGQKVIEQSNISTKTAIVPVKDLPNGVYSILISTSKGILPIKFIKN